MIKTGLGHAIQHYEIARLEKSGPVGQDVTRLDMTVVVRPGDADRLHGLLTRALEELEP